MSTKTETDLERTVREEQEAHEQALIDRVEQFVDRPPAEGTATGNDPDAGKLFDVPRVKVLVDETDPTILKLAFAGGIELDRTKADDVEFYNRLKAGKNVSLEIEAFVAGPKTTHRRDAEGDVDSVVQTKSLIIHSIDIE